jgi:hypothetical protein
MNTRMKWIITAVALAASGTAWAQEPEAPVSVNVEGLPAHVAKQVKEKAAQGPTALRRYINNTRMVNELHYWSVVKTEAPVVAAQEQQPQQVAARAGAPRE